MIGLGNLLLQDDGVGVHAAKELQKISSRRVVVADVGCAVLDALHLIEWADNILAIDAMQAGGEPGTIYSFTPGDVAEDAVQASLHELNLIAALRFVKRDTAPRIAILGVEPAVIGYSLDLSPEVQASLPRLVRAAVEIVDRWKSATA